MASYKRFEDLPVWQAATALAAKIFALTAHEAFKFRGDLVNQIRRASLSVSNNIAEGFERGSTADLINFLYIARGSCGETRSMLRFAPMLGGMDGEASEIESAAADCESVSRQLYGWIDALKNSSIAGDRKLTDQARADYSRAGLREEYRQRFNHEAEAKALAEGTHAEYLSAKIAAFCDLKDAEKKAPEGAPTCPNCGSPMVKRHDRNGKSFWGCTEYPRCRGSRPYKRI